MEIAEDQIGCARLLHIDGIDVEAPLRFVIEPLSITRIDRLRNGWRVVSVNQSVHNLPEIATREQRSDTEDGPRER